MLCAERQRSLNPSLLRSSGVFRLALSFLYLLYYFWTFIFLLTNMRVIANFLTLITF